MGLDISKIAERLAQLNSNSNKGGSLSFANLKDGRNVLRILPPAQGKDLFYTEAFLHYGVNPTEENKKGHVVVCPTTGGDHNQCPVCELAKELWKLSKKKGDTYDKQAKKISRKKRVYYNVIVRDDDLSRYKKDDNGNWVNESGEQESPIKVLSTGVSVLKAILGIIVDPEYGDITDAEKGLDVIITKSGTGLNTNYEVKTVRKESPIGFENWEENLNDLDSLCGYKSYEELENLLEGNDEESVEDEDEAPTSAPPKTPNKNTEEKASESEGAVEENEDALQAEIEAALKRRQKNK